MNLVLGLFFDVVFDVGVFSVVEVIKVGVFECSIFVVIFCDIVCVVLGSSDIFKYFGDRKEKGFYILNSVKFFK